MPVTIFLDFDGVLHPEHCHDSLWFLHLPLFESAIRGRSGVAVVVSSTWRRQHSLESLRRRFSPDVAPLIRGVTPRYENLPSIPDVLVNYQREAECLAWLEESGTGRWSPWIAVDDRSWGFRPFNKNVLLVDGKTGLREHDKAALIRLIVQKLQ